MEAGAQLPRAAIVTMMTTQAPAPCDCRRVKTTISWARACETFLQGDGHVVQWCRTPALMLTARHQLSHRVQGLDAGADDHPVKRRWTWLRVLRSC